VLSISSCTTSDKECPIDVIEVDIESNAEMNLSDYFENFRMVRLFTSDEVLIGQIKKVVLANNKIYVSDGSNLFIFDETGAFVSSINKRGQGPGEYAGIMDFSIDGENIIILSRPTRKLLVYNPSGEFISEYKFEYWAIALSPTFENNYILYCGNEIGDKNKHKLRFINRIEQNGNQKEIPLLPIDKNRAKYLMLIAPSVFFKSGNMLRFFEAYNDTIYTIKNNCIEPSLYIDYKGKNIPPSFFKKEYENIMEFVQSLNTYDYANGVSQFAENEYFKVFCSVYDGKIKLTVFDSQTKTSQTFATIRDSVFFNSLQIPATKFLYFASESIVFPVDAATIVEWKNNCSLNDKYKDLVNAVHEEDNYVLFIFDIKTKSQNSD
jgi:hypothetical protein